MNRRNFLRTTAGTTLALASVRSLFGEEENASPYIKEMGLQLYTLREALGKDTPGTMKAVAEAGYSQVEPYGFPDAEAMITSAKDLGLQVNSSHFDWNSILQGKDPEMPAFRKIVEGASGHGIGHLVIPFLQQGVRKDLSGYQKAAEKFNQAAGISKEAGIQLSYHNHNFEFEPMEEGKSGYDVFIEEFGPEMMFEIDVFWVKLAGHDPSELITKLKGRVSQLHLKDLKEGLEMPNYEKVPKDAFQEIGNGIIPMEPIMAAAKAAGVKNCHVEQDQSPHPVESVRESMRHLRA